MNPQIKKEVLFDINELIKILTKKEPSDFKRLEKLSDHAIEDVALYKDIDVISITVLIYSIYKVSNSLTETNYKKLLYELETAKFNLEKNNYSNYNKTIKNLFNIVKSCNARIKKHLDDVMHAAKISKGTTLLKKGLSIGQAAGLMGLSNWDLQQYAAKTTAQSFHEKVKAKDRLKLALNIFGVSK